MDSVIMSGLRDRTADSPVAVYSGGLERNAP